MKVTLRKPSKQAILFSALDNYIYNINADGYGIGNKIHKKENAKFYKEVRKIFVESKEIKGVKVTLRKPETQRIYERQMKKMVHEKGCRLCKLPHTMEFKSFFISPNEYPYDRLFKTDHMIILRSHRKRLNRAELWELESIKRKLSKDDLYDYAFENLPCQASIASHWHIHVLKR